MYKGNKGFILKFGDLAKTLSLEDWKTTSLEDLDSDTEWVAIVTDDAEAYLNEINGSGAEVRGWPIRHVNRRSSSYGT